MALNLDAGSSPVTLCLGGKDEAPTNKAAQTVLTSQTNARSCLSKDCGCNNETIRLYLITLTGLSAACS